MTIIDGKFRFIAVNPCHGEIHDETDACVFLARDAAFIKMVQDYPEICAAMGADPTQVHGAKLLVKRINVFALKHGTKVPDVVGPCETKQVMDPKSRLPGEKK